MRILEICPFSAGICGVWTRVLSESKEFVKLGHEVTVFSSDIEKGTGKNVSHEEKIGRITIKRFKTSKSIISENVLYWFYHKNNITNKNAKNELISYNPDVIITHLLHPHSANLCRLISQLKEKNSNIKIFLVPHAPFNVKRGFLLNTATKFWNWWNRPLFKKFDRIISITKWEKPYLIDMGVPEEKIVYIPNGIPDEFFTQNILKKPLKDVLFLGRIAPVKNLEVLIQAAKNLPQINFSIVGPAEEDYMKKMRTLIGNSKNINILPPVYDLREKIMLIDSHKIFVLPSKREAMPQVLIEAMSRGKVVVSSETDGGKEIIQNNKNGFLFKIGDYHQLASLIRENLSGNGIIQKNAKKDSEKYSWKNLIKIYREII